MGKIYDIIVAGSGPAGLAIASVVSRLGLKTAGVSPIVKNRGDTGTAARG